MTTNRRPACEWVGVDEQDERTVLCGLPATERIRERGGRIHYACAEHLAQVRARAGEAEVVHRPGALPARPYPEAMT